jgi:hypothetical protein
MAAAAANANAAELPIYTNELFLIQSAAEASNMILSKKVNEVKEVLNRAKTIADSVARRPGIAKEYIDVASAIITGASMIQARLGGSGGGAAASARMGGGARRSRKHSKRSQRVTHRKK